MFNHQKQKINNGFSLIELLVAMTLGLFLIGGAITMFMSNSRTYNEQVSMSRLQENARFALDILMRDIRIAGYSGCSDDFNSVTNNISVDAKQLLSFINAIEGIEQDSTTWKPSASTENITSIKTGTDGIAVRYFQNLSPLTAAMTTIESDLTIDATAAGGLLKSGDLLAVSDCGSADIFALSADENAGIIKHAEVVTNGTNNTTGNLSKLYLLDSSLMRVISRRYIIKDAANGQPSLFRIQYLKDAITDNFSVIEQELIPGVDNMQILYGVATGVGDRLPDTYAKASDVTQWNNVVSVRLALLLSTETDNFSALATSHNLLGEVISSNDKRRRRMYTATVKIRNRFTD